MKCVRVSEDINIKAYVYRCRSEPEAQGLDVLPENNVINNESETNGVTE